MDNRPTAVNDGGSSTTYVVTYASLNQTANALDLAGQTIQESLNTAKSEFENTKQNFSSKQSDDIRQKFEELTREFASFKVAVDNQSNFLKDAANKYKELDTNNTAA